jgi:hypothetical protein
MNYYPHKYTPLCLGTKHLGLSPEDRYNPLTKYLIKYTGMPQGAPNYVKSLIQTKIFTEDLKDKEASVYHTLNDQFEQLWTSYHGASLT